MYEGRFGKGYVPVPEGVHKASARPHFGAPGRQPAEWDGLSRYVAAIQALLDQKTANACVGFSLGVNVYLSLAAMGITIPPPSFAGIYFEARAMTRGRDEPLVDLGCNPEEAVLGVQKWGVPSAEAWPFDPATVNDEPDAEAVLQAYDFRVPGSYYIDSSGAEAIADVRQALLQNRPVSLGSQIDDAFEGYDGTGVIMPPTGKLLGGHMPLLVGYGALPGGRTKFRLLNWWGQDWGDGGFAWVDESWVEQATDRVVLSVEAVGGRGRR